MTTNELNVIIQALGTQQFQNQMRQCTTSSLAFKASIVAITAATAKFAKSAIELASDLEEVQNVVDVTFGDSAAKVNEFSKAAISSYGLSETVAKKYAGTFGSMAKSFGYTTDQATNMSLALTAMTGDVASFYNLDTDAAYTKLKSVFTGETESLKELGVVMTQTALDQYALSKGYSKTTKEMNEQEKVALRYQFVMEKLSGASGDYQRTSDGWANSIRTAKLQLQSMLAEIGTELMPAAKIALNYTMKGLKIVLGIIKPVATGISYIAQGWAASSKSTKVFIGIAAAAVVALMNFNKIAAITKGIVALVSGVVSILNMNLTATLTLTQALKGALGIIALIAGAIGAVKLISTVSDVFKKVEDSVNSASTSVSDINTDWETGEESVSDYNDSVQELQKSLMSFDEVNTIGNDKSLVGEVVSDDSLENLESLTDGLDDLFNDYSFDSINGLNDVFDGLSSKISDFFTGFMEKVNKTKTLWNELINAKTFEEKLGKVEEILGTWFPKWTEFWDEAGGVMYDIWHEKNWKKKLQLFDEFIRKTFSGSVWELLWDNSWGTVIKFWELTYDALTGDMSSLIADLGLIFNKISEIITLWKGFKNGFDSDSASTLGTVIGRIAAKLNGKKSSSSDKTLGYAAGGFPDMGELFVARENGPEMVGRIGNKTAVANNDQITTAIYNAVKSAFSGSNTGRSSGGTVALYVDGKVLGRATVDYINNQTMSSGQSPLVEIG